MTRGRRALLPLLLGVAASCMGGIGDATDPVLSDDDPGRPGPPPRGPGDEASAAPPAGPNASACPDRGARGASEGAVRPLSDVELASTYAALLGDALFARLEPRLSRLPYDGVKESVVELQRLHVARHAEVLMDVAAAAADLVVDDPAVRGRLVGPCALATTIAESCLTDFVRNFGLRVLRRPVRDEEVARLVATARSGVDQLDGLKLVIIRLLQSPSFLFHLETGGPAPAAGARVRLTDHEIASRLSYRLIGSMPDAELLAAAGRGELQALENVLAHGRRLLADPRARRQIDRFFDYWLQLSFVPGFNYTKGFLDGIDPAGLREEMVREAAEFVRHVVWAKRGAYPDLLESREVFARSERMASLYGVPRWSGAGAPPQARDERAGFLLRAAMLAKGEDITSPISRGVLIRRRILCDELPSPDDVIVNSRLDEVGHLDRRRLSSRQIVEKLTSASNCMACHTKINPVGFVLERFDGLGRAQTEERVFDAAGRIVARHPIVTHVDAPMLEGPDDPPLDSAADLMARIGRGDKGPACLARQIFRFTRLRPEAPEDTCAVEETRRALKRGDLLTAFLTSVVSEDILWKSAAH